MDLLNDRLLNLQHHTEESINSLFAEIDMNLKISRDTFSTLLLELDPNAALEWESTKVKAIVREEKDCPICIAPFENKIKVLLSCSHVFHEKCLESFVQYSSSIKCPMCRAEYTKIRW